MSKYGCFLAAIEFCSYKGKFNNTNSYLKPYEQSPELKQRIHDTIMSTYPTAEVSMIAVIGFLLPVLIAFGSINFCGHCGTKKRGGAQRAQDYQVFGATQNWHVAGQRFG
jgi:hypothetical protein